jgi:hypothetical protein
VRCGQLFPPSFLIRWLFSEPCNCSRHLDDRACVVFGACSLLVFSQVLTSSEALMSPIAAQTLGDGPTVYSTYACNALKLLHLCSLTTSRNRRTNTTLSDWRDVAGARQRRTTNAHMAQKHKIHIERSTVVHEVPKICLFMCDVWLQGPSSHCIAIKRLAYLFHHASAWRMPANP